MQPIDAARRRLFQLIGAAGGLLALGTARAHHTDTHFDDKSEHQIVYQCNKADNDYLEHILFSVGELIRKHGDNVEIVVACFGPGIHLLGDPPERPVAKELQERASSLSAYGVRFHACKNTMDRLKVEHGIEVQLLPDAEVIDSGVTHVVKRQRQGWSYIRV